jgi:hypothetical protein
MLTLLLRAIGGADRTSGTSARERGSAVVGERSLTGEGIMWIERWMGN